MTAAMEVGRRLLPPWERYPLPPREITSEMTRAAGVRQYLNEPEMKALTLGAHFAYGAAMGALFSGLVGKRSTCGAGFDRIFSVPQT